MALSTQKKQGNKRKRKEEKELGTMDEEKSQKKLETKKPKKVKHVTTTKMNMQESDLKNLSEEHILKCISAIFRLTQEQLNDKNDLLAEEGQPIFMQVTSVRVPKMPRRYMRILLPHSVVSPSDEVALFVCDLQKGRRKDYEPTVEHYRNLLDEHGCARVNEIIPMNRVKTEYDQFELKRKLVGSYDCFLVDGRIAGHMSHLLGKQFFARRRLPISIKMQSKDLKHEIEHALKKTSMHLHSHGDSHTMQIGNTLMSEREILRNVLAACKSLSRNYPGGWANIRSLRLKSATGPGLPIYITLKSKNTVEPPLVQPRRPKAYRDVKGMLSTFVSDTRVTVKPEGDVIVDRKRKTRKKVRARGNTEDGTED